MAAIAVTRLRVRSIRYLLSFLLTDAFAKSVNGLPAAEKAAALKRLQGSLRSNEVEIRRRAAPSLFALGDKRGVPTMIDDLSTATGRDRDNIVVALRIMKDERQRRTKAQHQSGLTDWLFESRGSPVEPSR
jgi:HEAT repeat protein